MTKDDIIAAAAKVTGLRQDDVKTVVRMLMDEIVQSLVDEGRMELRGFGVFEVKQRGARTALNPRTMERVHVPPKKVVKFKPGKLMGERIAGAARKP